MVLLCGGGETVAETFTIPVQGFPASISVNHAGLAANLVTPAIPGAPGFGPPTIFSAPLPSGSGARALGLAGAFTAVADDATAASWNPGGLTQLERPEASMVARYSHESDRHRSHSQSFLVGEDDFGDPGLNYFSLVWPFRFMRRNWVFSANYQEAYDFNQQFTANLSGTTTRTVNQTASGTFSETSTQDYDDGRVDITVRSRITTDTTSSLTQLLRTEMVSDLSFEQDGIISAISPSLAVQLTPKLSVGTTVNFYQHDLTQPDPIRSRTTANYSGTTASRAAVTTTRSSTGTYTLDGWIHLSGDTGLPPADIRVPTTHGEYPSFSDTTMTSQSSQYAFDGTYVEENEYDSMQGINTTIGLLWTVSRRLGCGLSVDLPWSMEGSQTRYVRNSVTIYDSSRSSILNSSVTEEMVTRDVEFHFPLYWAVGFLWRWNNRLYSTLDISETLWSDFWYRTEGEGKINPLNGSAYGQERIDDCWSVRSGIEYLWVLPRTEIPLRAGASWEQRPSIGTPDQYWGVSVGSGISMGRNPGKLIVDFAYMYSWGDDVMGSLVPEQGGLRTDVTKQQVYVSSIWHF